eukprot:3005458-Rhodomonas_salina.1
MGFCFAVSHLDSQLLGRGMPPSPPSLPFDSRLRPHFLSRYLCPSFRPALAVHNVGSALASG